MLSSQACAKQSPFYARRFAAADVRPGGLDLAGLSAIPVTLKRDLVERPEDVQCADVARCLATRTTGTTGRPAEIWLSRYEMELWPALGVLACVLRGELLPDDVLQVNVSSRATASVQLYATGCRLIGAGCRMLGIVPPDHALDALTGGGATRPATVPSYLAELEVAARRRGMRPEDFRLRTIDVGSEVLSPSLAQAARETFGVTDVKDVFSMTEVAPVFGRTCAEGHLHFDINTGLVEYLDLDTGEPAEPGALATVVITPYFPYRDCMPVFRYDTRDVVRCLPGDATCLVRVGGRRRVPVAAPPLRPGTHHEGVPGRRRRRPSRAGPGPRKAEDRVGKRIDCGHNARSQGQVPSPDSHIVSNAKCLLTGLRVVNVPMAENVLTQAHARTVGGAA